MSLLHRSDHDHDIETETAPSNAPMPGEVTDRDGLIAPEGAPDTAPDSAADFTPPAAGTRTPNRRGPLAVVATTAAALAAAGGAMVMSGDDGEPQNNDNQDSNLVVDHPADGEEVLTEDPTQTTITVETSTTVPEQPEIESRFEPKFITANNPEAILDEFAYNVEAAFNNDDAEMREKCLQYLFGTMNGELTSAYRERIGKLVNYRLTEPDPDFKVDISFANIDAKFYPDQVSPQMLTIVVDHTDHAGTTKVEYEFVKKTVTPTEYDELSSDKTVWQLKGEKFVS